MPCLLLIFSQSDFLIQVVPTNSNTYDKQCRSISVGFFRSPLIWICTVCKDRVYPGSAGQGLSCNPSLAFTMFRFYGLVRCIYFVVYHHFLAHLSSAQDELLWSLFVRRPSVRPSVRASVRPSVRPLTFSNDFSSEAAEPILLKFHMEPP